MSRRSLVLLAWCPTMMLPAALAAQEPLEPQRGEPPAKIDIRVPPPGDAASYEECERDQEAAAITGEIIVCRQRSGDESRLYDKESAERRHAQRTMNHNEIAAPDVAGAGIFRGPATVSGLCFIPPCPDPPAYMVDFSTLPDAPPGSDADRIARGLPPLGRTSQDSSGAEIIAQEELGLPPPPAEEAGEAVSPSGSASPAAEPSG